MLAAAGMAAGDGTVLMVDAGPPGARRAVDALPWVAGATFERRWPWTLVIRLTERSPVAARRSAGVVDVVDKSGRVLEASRSTVPVLPVIMGVKGAPAGGYVSPGTGLSQVDLGALLAAAGAAPRALAERQLRLAYSASAGLLGLYRLGQDCRVAWGCRGFGPEVGYFARTGDPGEPGQLLAGGPHRARAPGADAFTIRYFGDRVT